MPTITGLLQWLRATNIIPMLQAVDVPVDEELPEDAIAAYLQACVGRPEFKQHTVKLGAVMNLANTRGGGMQPGQQAPPNPGTLRLPNDCHRQLVKHLKLDQRPELFKTVEELVTFFRHTAPSLKVPVDPLAAQQLAGLPSFNLIQECDLSTASRLLSSIIETGPKLVHTGMDTSPVVANYLNSIFRLLHEFSPSELRFDFDISYNRTEKDVSLPAIMANARVDTYITIDNCVCFVGGDEDETMLAAEVDLNKKVKGRSSIDQGPVEFLLGYAAAKYEIQFYAITHKGFENNKADVDLVHLLERPLDLTERDDWIQLLVVLSKVYRVLGSMAGALRHIRKRILHYRAERSVSDSALFGDVTCSFTFHYMTKRIMPCDSYLRAFATTFETIQSAFEIAKTAQAMAHANGEPQFLVTCAPNYPQRNPVAARATKRPRSSSAGSSRGAPDEDPHEYVSVTYPLGWPCEPTNEEELRLVAKACLKTASALHEQNIVYRDWRPQNVVWINLNEQAPEPKHDKAAMVIDVESVAAADSVFPEGLPLLNCWDNETLDDERKFTKLADLRQIGMLLGSYGVPDLTPAALVFIANLRQKAFATAAAALADVWLSGAADGGGSSTGAGAAPSEAMQAS